MRITTKEAEMLFGWIIFMNQISKTKRKNEEQNSVLQSFYSILQIYVTVWWQTFVIQKNEMLETEIFFLGNIVYNGLFSIKILNTAEQILWGNKVMF
jgi:hypothetical protein